MKPLLLSVLILLFATSLWPQGDYENLVFEGAGMKGIAYSGVIKQLEDYGIMKDIKKVGGTSAGAITAVMVALHYDSEEIYQIISDTRFNKFNKGGWWIFGGIYRMKKRFGWYKSDKFDEWLEEIVKAKTGDTDITFSELKERGFKELYVVGTSLNRQELIVFSAETYPQMKVKDAVKASMSIPLYFEACFIDKHGQLYENPGQGKDLDIVVDGGITGNFPIWLFDQQGLDAFGSEYRVANCKTLGVRMDSDDQIEKDMKQPGLIEKEIDGLDSFLAAFFIMALENLNRNQLTPDDWTRTISVSSVGVSPKIKRMKKEEKRRLIESGEAAVRKHFDRE